MQARGIGVDEERLVRARQIEAELQVQVDRGRDPEIAGGAEPHERAEDAEAQAVQIEVERPARAGRRLEPEVEEENLVRRVERQDRRVIQVDRRQAEQRPQLRLQFLQRSRGVGDQAVDKVEEIGREVDEVADAPVDHRDREVEHVAERRVAA